MSERVKRWTKGDWQFDGYGNLKSEHSSCATGAIGVTGVALTQRAEAEANTVLLRAAPALVEALEDLLASNGPGPKSCGHDFTCVCAEDKAKEALSLAYGDNQ